VRGGSRIHGVAARRLAREPARARCSRRIFTRPIRRIYLTAKHRATAARERLFRVMLSNPPRIFGVDTGLPVGEQVETRTGKSWDRCAVRQV